MSKIIELFGNLDGDEEKLAFMESQFLVITNLNKQLEQIKMEKLHLERLLKDATQNLTSLPLKEDSDITTEQRICKEQLLLLKTVSEGRDLTLEECRKVEIYSKILNMGKDPNKKIKSSVEGLPIGELLKLVE